MAINGDDFYHPQSPSTPVGEEGEEVNIAQIKEILKDMLLKKTA